MKAALNIITIGKRLAPAEQIAFVEPFDPSATPEFQPAKGIQVAHRSARL